MEQNKRFNLPIIGRVQHGETIKTENSQKVKELGHFIAKIQNDYMQNFLDKFNSLYKGKQYIDIQFFDEEPLSIKNARYNQSGEVCSCHEGSNTASQKIKNGWKKIECTENCEYKQKNEQGKTACKRMAWLKFFIPSISTDRIWLMRITGNTSINRIRDYIALQKSQGKSIKGDYVLFLKQEEQDNYFAISYNNFILDIIKKEDFISNKTNSQISQISETLSTNNSNSVDNNNLLQENKNLNVTQVNSTDNTTKNFESSTTSKSNAVINSNTNTDTITTLNVKDTKTKKKSTKKKDLNVAKSENANSTENSDNTEDFDIDNCYILLNTSYKDIKLESGEIRTYLVGEFSDSHDNISNIFIKQEFEKELINCDLGTVVELEIKNVKDMKFAVSLKFISKQEKTIAA